MTVGLSLVDAMRAIAELRQEVLCLRKRVDGLECRKPQRGEGGSVPPEDPRGIMRAICRSVAAQYGVTVDDLRGPSTQRYIAWPRQHAYARCRAAGKTLNQIGRYFGGRDHKTIHTGIRRHMERTAQE